MSEYVVYSGHDKRIVYVVKNTPMYLPVVFEKIHFHYMDYLPPEDPYYDYSVVTVDESYSYLKRLEATSHIKSVIEKEKQTISILENMNNFSRFYLRAYETNYVSRYINFYLYEELETYEKTGKVGTVLKSIQEFEKNYSIEDVVGREKLKREDVKNMLSYLNTIELMVRKLIKEEKFDEAKHFIIKERGKTGW